MRNVAITDSLKLHWTLTQNHITQITSAWSETGYTSYMAVHYLQHRTPFCDLIVWHRLWVNRREIWGQNRFQKLSQLTLWT